MRIRTLALCLAISTVTAFAQHDSAAWYHPLNTGNEWLFKKTESTHSFMQPTVTTKSFFSRTVTGDTVIDDKQYSIILEQDLLSLQTKSIFERYDSLNGTFYRLSSSTEEMLDSVFCQSPNMPFDGMKMKFIGAAADTFIGSPTHTRTTQLNVTGATVQWSFSYGIGITKETDWSQDSFFGTDITHALVHAKISGVEYGTKTALIADSLACYHPLQNGNKWIYKVTSYNFPSAPSISYTVREIIEDTIIHNVLYKKIIGSSGSVASIERFDDITGNYIHHSAIGSVVEDSTAAHIANTYFGLHESRKLNSVYTDSVLGASRLHREIVIANQIAENEMGWVYAYGLGRVKYYIKELSPSPYGILDEDLVYAKINGVEYGTEPLSVDGESYGTPIEFALYQNYPNPFNPITMITFRLPSNMDVSLKVYNVVGMETATIAVGRYPAGIHSVQWRPDGLGSGVYFYSLRAGKFTQTKRLILLK